MIYSEFNQLLTARESYKISHVKFREKSNNSYGWQQFIFIAKQDVNEPKAKMILHQ